MTMRELILEVLKAGPASSSEVAARAGVCPRSCSAMLSMMTAQGQVKRSERRMPRDGMNSAFLYAVGSGSIPTIKRKVRPARYPRRPFTDCDISRLPSWIRRYAKRWGVVRVYVHPCGDLILAPGEGEGPYPDRMLMGTYPAYGDADITGDIETELTDWEEAA